LRGRSVSDAGGTVLRTIVALALVAVATATVIACDDASAPDGPPGGDPTPIEPAITVNQPAIRANVAVPFAISGSANVFEGALSVRVVDAAGQPLCERFVQATAGSGTRGNWTTTMAFVPPQARSDPPTPEPVEATIRAFTYSADDGSERDVTLHQIILSHEVPAITIEEPACNTRVSKSAPLVVNGEALVFEAALTVELRTPSGETVLTQNILALDGTQRSPWTATFDISGPDVATGNYDLVALSFSAEDGSPENIFAIPIEVAE
jgi:hypothetical protein